MSDAPTRARRPWWRRILRGLGFALTGLVVVAITAVAVIVGTDAGTRWALRTFVARYDAAIPGRLELGEIEGNLAGGVVLHDLRLADARDRELVTLARAELEVAIWPLWVGHVEVTRLDVTDARIHHQAIDPSWGDLGPAGGAPPDPDAPPGPDLPITLDIALQVDGLRFAIDDAAGSRAMVDEALATIDLHAEGRTARADIRGLSGRFGPQGYVISAAAGALTWDAPDVGIEQLSVLSEVGLVRRIDGRLHTDEPSWWVELEAVPWPSAFVKDLELPPPLVRLRGEGTFEAAQARVHLDTPGVAVLDVYAGTTIDPGVTTIEAHGSGWIVADSLLGRAPGEGPGRRSLALVGGARIDTDSAGDTSLEAAAAIVSDAVVATAHAYGDRIDADVFAPGAHVAVRAERDAEGLREARAHVDVSAIDRVLAEAQPFVPAALPAARGRLAADATCIHGHGSTWRCDAVAHGGDLSLDDLHVDGFAFRGHATPGADRLRFDAAVEVDSLRAAGTTVDAITARAHGDPSTIAVTAHARRGYDDVRVRATVMPGPDPLTIALESLTADVSGQPIATRRSAWLHVYDDAVDVDGLDVRVARGRLQVDGRAAWKGRSDLVVDASRLDLGLVHDFVPAVPIAGRLDARIELQGQPSAPTLLAGIDAHALRWDDRRLGDVGILAGYDDGNATVDLRWEDRGATARVRAEVPAVVDAAAKRVALDRRHPASVGIDLHDVPLARVGEWVDGFDMSGRVDATVRAHGTLADPLVALHATGVDLRYDDETLGGVSLDGTWDGRRVDAVVHGRGPAVREILASASVPLRLDARRGTVRLDAEGDHRVALDVRGVKLARIPVVDTDRFAGELDVVAKVHAEGSKVDGSVQAMARNLVVDEHRIGAAELVATLDPRQLKAHALVGGTRVRMLEAHAEVPLRVDGPLGPFAIRPDDPLLAWAELRDLDLALVGAAAGDASLGGRARGRLAVEGTLRTPRVDADVYGERIAVRGSALGRAHAQIAYDGGSLDATIEQSHGWERVDLTAHAPIDLDFATPNVRWHDDREHTIDLRLQGVDRALVETFVELPPGLDLSASGRVRVHGTVADPHALATVRAELAMPDSVPTPVSVRVELAPNAQRARVLFGARDGKELAVEARTNARIAALIDGSQAVEDIEIVATADSDGLDLRTLAPVAPGQLYDPRGKLVVHAKAEGPILTPALSGRVAMDDAAMTIVALDQRFRSVVLRAELEGPDITLSKLVMRSGEGSAVLSAQLHLAPQDTHGEAELVAKKLPVLRPGLPLMRLDGRVKVDLDATGALTKVDVKVHDGFVDVVGPELVEQPASIPEDTGVEFVDAKGLAAARRAETKQEQTPWMPQEVDLSLALADPVRVRGNGIDMDWNGRVTVRTAPGRPPQADGSFTNEGGRVSFLNNDFSIVRGEIRLPGEGELDPFVDVTATTSTEQADVTLAISGRVSRPRLRLSSSPALSEDQIFALLITGDTDPGEGEGGDEFAAKAAGVLAAFQNSTLQQALRDRVGIDRVGVTFGDTVDQPVLVVGKRVTRDLYVETGYHHNAPVNENGAEVRVEYEFAPRWSIDTFFGDAAQGGVGLWWTRRFGKTAPPPPSRDDEAVPPARDASADR